MAHAAIEQVRQDGPTVGGGEDGGMMRRHPASSVAKDALAAYRAVIRDLGLRDVEAR